MAKSLLARDAASRRADSTWDEVAGARTRRGGLHALRLRRSTRPSTEGRALLATRAELGDASAASRPTPTRCSPARGPRLVRRCRSARVPALHRATRSEPRFAAQHRAAALADVATTTRGSADAGGEDHDHRDADDDAVDHERAERVACARTAAGTRSAMKPLTTDARCPRRTRRRTRRDAAVARTSRRPCRAPRPR